MASPYRRDNNPPPSGPRFKLHRLKASEYANFSFFGEEIHGFWTHWGRRTEPCVEPKEFCKGCQEKQPSRWKGYVFCRREDTGELGFLECTPKLRDDVLSKVGGRTYLRGARLKILRGKGDKTSCTTQFLRPFGQEFPGQEMPADVDPGETLRMLFEWRKPRDDGKGAA